MSDKKRQSKDAITGALMDQVREMGAEPSLQKVDAYLIPVLEEADKRADEASVRTQVDPGDKLADKKQAVEAKGGKWIEVDDVGEVTFHRNGKDFTVSEALLKLAGVRGVKAETVRRRVWLKYLRENYPGLWAEFATIAKDGGPAEVVERKLHEALERSKRLVPVNPWNPIERKLTIC